MSFALPLFYDQFSCQSETNELEPVSRRRLSRAKGHEGVIYESPQGTNNDRRFSAPHAIYHRIVRFEGENDPNQIEETVDHEQGDQDEKTPERLMEDKTQGKSNYESTKNSEQSNPPQTPDEFKKPALQRGRSILVLLKRLSSKEFSKEKLTAAKNAMADENSENVDNDNTRI